MDNEIGEYTALAAFGGRIYGSWMEVVSPPAQGSYGPHAASVIRLGMADFSGNKRGEHCAKQKRLRETYDKVT